LYGSAYNAEKGGNIIKWFAILINLIAIIMIKLIIVFFMFSRTARDMAGHNLIYEYFFV
jgi:hypothetical protein